MSAIRSGPFRMAYHPEEPAAVFAEGPQLRDADTGEVYAGHRLKRSPPGHVFVTEGPSVEVNGRATSCKSDSCFAVLNVRGQSSGWSRSASSVNRCSSGGPFCHRRSEENVGDTLRFAKRPSLESVKTLTPCKSAPSDGVNPPSLSLQGGRQRSLENLQICPWCQYGAGPLMKRQSFSQDGSDGLSRCSSGLSVEYLTPTSSTCLKCPGLPSRLKPTVHPRGFIKYFCTDIRVGENYYEKMNYGLPSPSLSDTFYKMSVSRLSGGSPSTEYAGFSPVSVGSSPSSSEGEDTLALPQADVVCVKPYTSSGLVPLKHAAGLVLKTVAVVLFQAM